jgi:hypothetical protein
VKSAAIIDVIVIGNLGDGLWIMLVSIIVGGLLKEIEIPFPNRKI